MKPEDQAWQSLRDRAAAELRTDFADRVVRAARGPQAADWQALQDHASAQLRAGFADRVLQAARRIPGVPTLLDQFALSAVTAAACLFAVVLAHSLRVQLEDDRNLAGWQEIADELADLEQFQ